MSIKVIFNNLSGKNFGGAKYDAYLKWMRWFSSEARLEVADPYGPGERIVLVDGFAEATDEHRFSA